MREGLLHQVKSGDDALERHIMEQVAQLRSLIEGQGRLVGQAAESAQRAISKAEEATEKWLQLPNEFRAQQGDESKKYSLRETVEKQFSDAGMSVSKLENQISRLYGGIAVVGIIGNCELGKTLVYGTLT
jgi:hypothetical protein